MIEYITELSTFILSYWWFFLIIGFVLAAFFAVYKDTVKVKKKYKYYGTPPNTPCPSNSNKLHQWETGGWNGSIYHHGAVSRTGLRCYHCGEMVWKETDAEFVANQPVWMLQSPHCKIPKMFLQYIPKEVLDKRIENIHNMKLEQTKEALEYHKEQEMSCLKELFELQSA